MNSPTEVLTTGLRRSGLRRRSPQNQRRAWRLLLLVCCGTFVMNFATRSGLTSGAAEASAGVVQDENGSAPDAGPVEPTTAQEGEEHKDGEHPGGDGDDSHDGSQGHAGDDHGGGHKDPVSDVLLAIVLILLCAKVCGDLSERVGLPAVLGELCVGVLIGNWAMLTGSDVFDFLKPSADGLVAGSETGYVIDILARIGVVLLLFEVGLESRVHEMLSVGVSSLVVALLGVVAPMALGWGVGWVLLRDAGWQVHAFLGATLCATSVGITARVLKDLGRSQDRESRIILGAAVIDDVLGLIVLAVVSGVIRTGDVKIGSVGTIVALSFGFLAGAMLLGALQLPRVLFKAASYLRGHGLLVVTALVICFGFSYAANLVQLAPIVGAFAAGLILEGAHYQDAGERWKTHSLEDALAPLSALLVPIFFVGMGLQVDLASFGDPSVWMLAGALTVVAVIGKQVCALGVWEPGLNKVAVGLGMIPRGEVGLIFANEGRQLVSNGSPVIDTQTYSALVVMVMVTTMVTPPLLKWSLSRQPKAEPGEAPTTLAGDEA